MDAFISKKRRRISHDAMPQNGQDEQEDSTELKLALLASMHPDVAQDTLLEALLSSDGHVETASEILANNNSTS